jgi:hypothetical protein
LTETNDDFLTDAEMRDRDKSNILNVSRLMNWRVSGMVAQPNCWA